MFCIAEFAVESILREGLEELKDQSTIDMKLTDIFGRLRDSYMTSKYGSTEIDKIKEVLLRGEFGVIHSLSQLQDAGSRLPNFSLHLLGDSEAEDKAAMDDSGGLYETPIDPEIIVSTFNATSIILLEEGILKVIVPNTTDLSNVYANRWLIDNLGNEYKIIEGISNTPDDKYFTIESQLTPNLTGMKIVSAVNVKINEVKFIPANERIMIGVHSENALLTKYLYYILRYILYSKKGKFVQYNLILSKFDGSDFSLSQPTLPETIFSRWITTNFITYNYWRGPQIDVIDAINPSIGGHAPGEKIACGWIPISYDPNTGTVRVPDSVDLSRVQEGQYLFDKDDNSYKILGNIINTVGNKQFNIEQYKTLNILDPVCIKKLYSIHAEAESEREDAQNMTWDTID